MTEASKEDDMVLEKVSYVHHPIRFKKNKVRALINLNSKVNAMTLTYIAKLAFKIRLIDVGAQKIYGSNLEIFIMLIAIF